MSRDQLRHSLATTAPSGVAGSRRTSSPARTVGRGWAASAPVRRRSRSRVHSPKRTVASAARARRAPSASGQSARPADSTALSAHPEGSARTTVAAAGVKPVPKRSASPRASRMIPALPTQAMTTAQGRATRALVATRVMTGPAPVNAAAVSPCVSRRVVTGRRAKYSGRRSPSPPANTGPSSQPSVHSRRTTPMRSPVRSPFPAAPKVSVAPAAAIRASSRVPAPRTSSSAPEAATAPSTMIARWSQTCSTRTMTWLDTTTEPPAATKRRRMSRIVAAEIGSTGSSRTRSRGRCTRAVARPIFLRIPEA